MAAASYKIFVRRILGTGGPGAFEWIKSAQFFSDPEGSSLAEKQPMSLVRPKMIGYRNALWIVTWIDCQTATYYLQIHQIEDSSTIGSIILQRISKTDECHGPSFVGYPRSIIYCGGKILSREVISNLCCSSLLSIAWVLRLRGKLTS